MIDEAALDELRDRNPVADVATAAGARLRRSGRSLIGSCPLCSARQSGSATRFEIKEGGRAWVCAVCADGGDVIRLVERIRGCSFLQAVDYLGGAQAIDPAEAARRAAERAAKQAKQDAARALYRERERQSLLWLCHERARPIGRSPVETYLRARGLELPRTPVLHYLPGAPYFHGTEIDEAGRSRPRVIHRGPAMVAEIIRAGEFSGLHFTYLAQDGSGKATIVDPNTGDLLPSKKIRGSKTAGAIPLISPSSPTRLFWGEGIETVLTMAQDRDLARPTDAFWSAVDLGNIGGRSRKTVAHPCEKTADGRARRIAGPEPDLEQPAVAIPDSVVDLVILGDCDSDEFETENAAVRCAKRYARPGRTVRVAWAPPGQDFNDMRRALG